MASANMAKIVRARIGKCRRSNIMLCQWVKICCIRVPDSGTLSDSDRHVGTNANPGGGMYRFRASPIK